MKLINETVGLKPEPDERPGVLVAQALVAGLEVEIRVRQARAVSLTDEAAENNQRIASLHGELGRAEFIEAKLRRGE